MLSIQPNCRPTKIMYGFCCMGNMAWHRERWEHPPASTDESRRITMPITPRTIKQTFTTTGPLTFTSQSGVCLGAWGIRFDVMMSINIFWYEGCWHVKWMKCCSLASQTSESSLVPIAPEVSPPQRRLLHQRKGGLCPWHIFLAFHQGTFALRPGPPGLVSIGELNRSPCRGTAPYTRLNDF